MKLEQAGNRSLLVSLAGPSSAVRVMVRSPASGPRTDGKTWCEICGADSSPYGMLVGRPNDGKYEVVKDGRTQLIITDESGDMRLKVVNAAGETLASLTCGREGYGGILHLEVMVHPAVDPVLVLACVLAVILLL